ncbi:HAMP domain-containing sensor histidine kinase [Roseburia hominis]
MDWLEEKVEKFRLWLQNLSLCRALTMYLALAITAAALVSYVTQNVLTDWSVMIYRQYGADLPNAWRAIEGADQERLICLQKCMVILPFCYVSMAVLAAAVLFWHKRLKKPFSILQASARAIREHDLDFRVAYDSRDEMGELCRSFEDMRMEMVCGKEEMWRLIEEQRRINAAFAHDLRTPLTVLRGYSDFLYRYIPEGKVSMEKMTATLKLMSEHIRRLESYSYTMKGIRSFEELAVQKEEMDICRLAGRMEEMTEALNRIGDVEISFHFVIRESEGKGLREFGASENDKDLKARIDENMILEVVENLVSNAIRYARRQVELMLEVDAKEEMLYLTVSDDGMGFTEEEREKAVLPYFHGNAPGAEEKNTHFGIGLYISQILSRKHGGTLSLANRMEGGALVSVSFSYRES